MEKKKVFRKSYLVKQRLQLKVFGLVVLMLFSFTLVIGVSLYLPLIVHPLLQSSTGECHPPGCSRVSTSTSRNMSGFPF